MVVPNYVGTHLREAELSADVNSIGPILCPELIERSRLPIPISIDGVSEVKEKVRLRCRHRIHNCKRLVTLLSVAAEAERDICVIIRCRRGDKTAGICRLFRPSRREIE
jgi:hypothetical protein